MNKIVLALPVLMALACHPKGQKTVLFFGDSITAMADEPSGYLVKLQDMLAEKGRAGEFKIIGSGIPGDKIYDLLFRFEREILMEKPQIVVVFIGVNDVWHKRTLGTGTDADKFKTFYSRLIKKMQAQQISVVLATPACIGEKTDGSNENDPELDFYSQMIRKLANSHGCNLVDLRNAFLEKNRGINPQNLEKGILTVDGVHFNEAGNMLAAEAFFEMLKSGY